MKRSLFMRIVATVAKLLTWYLTWYHGSNTYINPGVITRRWTNYVTRWYERYGLIKTVELLKKIRGQLMSYIAGGSDDWSRLRILPHSLRRGLRDRDLQSFQVAMTVLSLGRGFRRGGLPDFSNITSPPKSSFDVRVEEDFIGFVASECVPVIGPLETDWEAYHFSTKAGPKGPAMLTSIADLVSLPPTLRESIETLGGPALTTRLARMDTWLRTPLGEWASNRGIKDGRGSWLRAISVRSDRELKLRPFAIFDYWSQCALNRLHREIFSHLKGFKTDFTFRQLEAIDYLKSIQPSDHYWSLDLTAATDRFPARTQAKVLALFIGEAKAKAWLDIMVGYPFKLTHQHDHPDILYQCGQPMGAYSSWAVFTLTHHFLVRYAANDLTYKRYALLGDDIVICDDDVAKRLMAVYHALGVEVNLSKTLVSKDTFEFAKRLVTNGADVSPFPIMGLKEVYRVPTLLYLWLAYEGESRGQPELGFTSQMADDLYRRFGKAPFARRVLLKHWDMAVTYPLLRVKGEANSATSFLRKSGLTLPCRVSETFSDLFLAETTATVYANFLLDAFKTAQARQVAMFQPDALGKWGGPVVNDPEELMLYPVFGANLALLQDYQDILLQIRTKAREGSFHEMLEDRVAPHLADPNLLLDGNRTQQLVGAVGRLLQRTVTLLKSIEQTRSAQLATAELPEDYE